MGMSETPFVRQMGHLSMLGMGRFAGFAGLPTPRYRPDTPPKPSLATRATVRVAFPGWRDVP